MSVFCFNKVIYDGYLSIDLFFFIIKHKFLRIFAFFSLIPFIFKFLLKQIDSTSFMAMFYEIVLENITVSELNLFKTENIHKVDLVGFGIKKDDPNNIIVTGEPSFLVDLFINRNKYRVVCSEYDLQTRKFSNKICVDKRKVEKLKEIGVNNINQLFIFSFKDSALMNVADYIYVYRGHQVIDYDTYKGKLFDKVLYDISNKKLMAYTFVSFILSLICFLIISLLSFFIDGTYSYVFGFIIWFSASYYAIVTFVNQEKFSFKYIVNYLLGVLPNFLTQLLIVIVLITYLSLSPILVYILGGILAYPTLIFLLGFYKFD